MITVVLNVYNRPYTLEAQIKAIKEQTVKVADEDIWIWYNKGDVPQPVKYNSPHKVFICNHNTKFHGRFTACLLVKTPYIALLDDDIVPGNKWFENCLKTIKEKEGILGGSGVLLKGYGYFPNEKVGWNGRHSKNIEKADLIGHSWFLKKEWVKYLFYEETNPDNGEDIALCALAQKYGNIQTYVPPHPETDVELWSNNPAKDNNWGSDKNASYIRNSNHNVLRDNICRKYIDDGWKLCRME